MADCGMFSTAADRHGIEPLFQVGDSVAKRIMIGSSSLRRFRNLVGAE
jgi:hypothetical protein